jgi:rhodanese-related sulfurtransferase
MTPRKILLALSLLALVPLAQAQPPAQGDETKAPAPAYQAKSPKLDRARVDALLATPEKVLVLDVRRPDELVNIGGFPVYLSIQAADLEKSLAFIPRDRIIVTVSNHAARALKAADLLAGNGFTVAGAVGVQDYQSQGGTIVKIAAPAPGAITQAAH